MLSQERPSFVYSVKYFQNLQHILHVDSNVLIISHLYLPVFTNFVSLRNCRNETLTPSHIEQLGISICLRLYIYICFRLTTKYEMKNLKKHCKPGKNHPQVGRVFFFLPVNSSYQHAQHHSFHPASCLAGLASLCFLSALLCWYLHHRALLFLILKERRRKEQ